MPKILDDFLPIEHQAEKVLNSRIGDLKIRAGVWWWGYATAGVNLGEKGLTDVYPKSVSYLLVMENGKTKQRCNHVIRSCDLFPEIPNIELSDEKLAAHPTTKLRFLRMAGRAIWVQLMRWRVPPGVAFFWRGFVHKNKNPGIYASQEFEFD